MTISVNPDPLITIVFLLVFNKRLNIYSFCYITVISSYVCMFTTTTGDSTYGFRSIWKKVYAFLETSELVLFKI